MIYFGPGLDKRLEFLRSIVPSPVCHYGVTLVGGLIVARFATLESSYLKVTLRSFLREFGLELGGGPFQVPKMWDC